MRRTRHAASRGGCLVPLEAAEESFFVYGIYGVPRASIPSVVLQLRLDYGIDVRRACVAGQRVASKYGSVVEGAGSLYMYRR